MTRHSTDSHADARRSTKPPIQRTQDTKRVKHKSADSKDNKSKIDPVNSDETLRRNVNGNS